MGAAPNASGVFGGFISYGAGDPDNAPAGRFYNNGGFGLYIESFKTGSAAVPPIYLLTNGNVGLTVTTDTTPSVIAGTAAALATNATVGFFYVPTSVGAPTGAAVAQTGKAPIEIDTTNDRSYFYANSNWSFSAPSYAVIQLTGQTASIGAGNIQRGGAVLPQGLYEVVASYQCTTAGSAGTVSLTIGWNNGGGARSTTATSVDLNSTSSSTSFATTLIRIWADGSTNVTYATTVTGASGSPQYRLDLVLRRCI